MTGSTPYNAQPDTAFWRRSVSALDWDAVDPVVDFPLQITKKTRVATAGSCFAQHIARHLTSSGYNYYVTEPGHPVLPAAIRKKYNYGMFSARYGNIYTAAQLKQLSDRAFGKFVPTERDWQIEGGRWVDPFRPNIFPGGFISHQELLQDREQHFAAVRELFENVEVFVFTLGLTEAWRSREDGAVFPLCPGVKGGDFNNERYEFVNYEMAEIVQQVESFIKQLRTVNRFNCKVILTVSPVPLMATATNRHVLVASMLSKSVLCAAADYLRRMVRDVYYFPSFEIITGAHTRGRYFGNDLREVESRGVQRVMSLFFKHVAGDDMLIREIGTSTHVCVPEAPVDAHLSLGTKLMKVLCDEELLDSAGLGEA